MLQAIIFLVLTYLALGFFTAGCFLEQGIVHKHNIVIIRSLKPIYMAGILVILWPVSIGLVIGSLIGKSIRNKVRSK